MKKLMFCLLALILLAGCRSLDWSDLFKSDSQRETDQLWRQGYGYNNPNVDRLRNRQNPQNFNGKEASGY